MAQLRVKQEKNKFNIYLANEIYAEIIFENAKNAILKMEDKILRVVEGETKDMVLKENDKTLFTFKFDYLSGNAEIISDGVDTGYDIIGRWFKPGSRLINDEDKDLVIVKNKKDDLEVTITEVKISKIMVVATIYYHIYASRGKLLAVLFGTVAG